MADTTNIMGLVAAFIGIAIMLGIGIQILGNTTFDCDSLDGEIPVNGTEFDSWRGQCDQAETDTQSAYNLLLVILIVIAAVAILFVVRML